MKWIYRIGLLIVVATVFVGLTLWHFRNTTIPPADEVSSTPDRVKVMQANTIDPWAAFRELIQCGTPECLARLRELCRKEFSSGRGNDMVRFFERSHVSKGAWDALLWAWGEYDGKAAANYAQNSPWAYDSMSAVFDGWVSKDYAGVLNHLDSLHYEGLSSISNLVQYYQRVSAIGHLLERDRSKAMAWADQQFNQDDRQFLWTEIVKQSDVKYRYELAEWLAPKIIHPESQDAATALIVPWSDDNLTESWEWVTKLDPGEVRARLADAVAMNLGVTRDAEDTKSWLLSLQPSYERDRALRSWLETGPLAHEPLQSAKLLPYIQDETIHTDATRTTLQRLFTNDTQQAYTLAAELNISREVLERWVDPAYAE
ncbi:MAG: hypothetical protein SFY80_02000 [Verrucomicrobiota bacterium]|nr:hypothetical protein [Verrucomicrobiota bacterium]